MTAHYPPEQEVKRLLLENERLRVNQRRYQAMVDLLQELQSAHDTVTCVRSGDEFRKPCSCLQCQQIGRVLE
jgi:hypothetical protein